MSLLGRLRLRRSRDAMAQWRSDLGARTSQAASRTPDLDPSEVVMPERVGMDGRPLPKSKGALTGLEGGGGGSAPYDGGN